MKMNKEIRYDSGFHQKICYIRQFFNNAHLLSNPLSLTPIKRSNRNIKRLVYLPIWIVKFNVLRVGPSSEEKTETLFSLMTKGLGSKRSTLLSILAVQPTFI